MASTDNQDTYKTLRSRTVPLWSGQTLRKRHPAQGRGTGAATELEQSTELKQSDHREQSFSTTCSVCLDIISSRAVLEPCLHEFDLLCIETWTRSHNTCPVCRTPAQQILYDISSDTSYKVKKVAPRATVMSFRLENSTVAIVVPLEGYEESVWLWSTEEAVLIRITGQEHEVHEEHIGDIHVRTLYRLRNYDDEIYIRDSSHRVHNVHDQIISFLNSLPQ